MSNKLKTTLFTLCVFTTFLCAEAAQNQILSTGIRKVSDNTVNFTFYTSNDNQEKPIVKSKGNNEYTILLPNLSDNTSRSINIGATDGIVTSADVKTINEGAVTYTKINLKTSKPVTINAETRKTTQTASDVSSLNSIVSKVNLINQDVKNISNIQTSSTPKTSTVQQPVMKASSVKDIIRQNSASAPRRNVIQEAVAANNVASHTPDSKKIEKTEIAKTPTENIKNIKPVSNVTKTPKKAVKTSTVKPSTVKTPKIETPVKAEENKPADKALENIATVDTDVNVIPEKLDEEVSKDINETDYKNSFSFAEGFKKIIFSPVTTVILLICALLAFFAFLFKKLTSNISLSKNINDSLIEKLNSVLNKPKKKDFTDIVTNENLSWQEKYRAFNEKNNTPTETENKKIDGNYVLELSNKINENDNTSGSKADNSRFKGFGNSSKQNAEGESKISKSYKLKSFRNDSGSKQSMRDKLDDIMENETPTTVTNSIKKSHDPQNMRIMLNSAIDNDREFYIVSDNDEYSLLGRIKNKLVILKNFGKNAPTDLLVRRAQGNAFVVKAGDYRCQVNVSESDMNIYSHV